MVRHVERRSDSFARNMRLHGVPLLAGKGRDSYALQGIPGFAFRFAGRALFSTGRGGNNVNIPTMLAILAAGGNRAVTVQHHKGTPYDEAIVSMYARDWAVLMLALIESDPERYSIQKKGSQA